VAALAWIRVMQLSREQKVGGIFAASAYTLWGIAPLYFKSIDFVPALEILLHRIVCHFCYWRSF